MADDQDSMMIPIGVTEKRYLRQLAKLEAQSVRSAKEIEKRFKASNRGTTRSFKSLERGFRKTTGAGNHFTGGMRNVSLQLSQVGQQAMVTGDPLRALAVQLPDLSLGFGTLGIALGVVGGALLPLAVDFLTASDNAEELETSVDELGKAVGRYEAAAENAARPTSNLKEEYGELAEEARALFAAQRDLEKLDVMSGLQAVQSSLAGRFGVLDRFKPEDYSNAGVAVQRLQDRLAELRDGAEPISIDEGQRIQAEINALGRLAEAVQRVQSELGVSAEKAGEFASALSAFQSASPGTEAQATALRSMREVLVGALTTSKEMTEEQEALARKVLESEQSLLTFLATMTEASTVTADAAGQAGTLADNVSRAAQAAIDFVANLGSASLAGLRAEVAALEDGGTKADAAAAKREAEIRTSPEFQRALQGPQGLRQEALSGLRSEVQSARDKVSLSNRRSAALKAASTPSSGGGGGGAAQEQRSIFEATDRTTERLEQQLQTLGKSRQRVAELQAKWALLAEAKRQGIPLTDELRARIEAEAQAVGGLAEKVGQAEDRMQAMEEVSQSIGDALMDAALNGSDAFESLAASIKKAALQYAIFGNGPLAGIFGEDSGGGLAGILGGLITGNASGVRSFRGGLSRVNEHGGEIMNLPKGTQIIPHQLSKRMIEAPSGASAVNVEFRVENNVPGVEVRQRRQRGPSGEEMVIATVNSAGASGELPGVAGRYGLKDQKVRR